MLKFKVLLIFFIQGGKMNFFFLMQIRFFVFFLNDKDLLIKWFVMLGYFFREAPPPCVELLWSAVSGRATNHNLLQKLICVLQH